MCSVVRKPSNRWWRVCAEARGSRGIVTVMHFALEGLEAGCWDAVIPAGG